MTDSSATRSHAALVRIDPGSGARTSIPFQFNPATLKRALQPATVGGQPGGHSEAVRFSGAPTEVFSFNVELDAYSLEDSPMSQQWAPTLADGFYGMLYALETLIYPPSADIELATQQLAGGALEIAPSLAPPALLVWGGNRVVPVVVQSLEIVEQAYDKQLNPLRVVVSLTLRVVSYSDVVSSSAVYGQYLTYQKSKEGLSQTTTPS